MKSKPSDVSLIWQLWGHLQAHDCEHYTVQRAMERFAKQQGHHL